MALGPRLGLPMAAGLSGPRQRGGGLLGLENRGAGGMLEGSFRWVFKAGAARKDLASLWPRSPPPGLELPIGERVAAIEDP